MEIQRHLQQPRPCILIDHLWARQGVWEGTLVPWRPSTARQLKPQLIVPVLPDYFCASLTSKGVVPLRLLITWILGVDQLVSTICKPSKIKDGTGNLRVNVPFCLQELIVGTCFAIKYQCHCRQRFMSEYISQDDVKELCLHQQKEEVKKNLFFYANCPKFGAKNCAAWVNFIEKHFQQIQGIHGVLCAFLISHLWTLSLMFV